MEKEKLWEETVAKIRGCLISVKGKVDLRELTRDYRQMIGTAIPFKELGFFSLEEFLRKVPSLAVSKDSEGHIMVDAKANEKTSHISSMVARQKTIKKKPNNLMARPHLRPRSFQQHIPAKSKWRPKDQSDKWKSAEIMPRTAAISHNQFVNYPKPIQQSPKSPLTTINNNVYKEPSKKSDITPDPTYKRQFSFNRDNCESHVSPTQEKTAHSAKTNRTFLMQRNSSSDMVSPLRSPKIIENPTNWKPDTFSFQNERKEVPFNPSGDDVNDLYAYAKYMKLSEPIFKVMQRQSKPHKAIFYDCQVKIDSLSMSSYPKDFPDEQSAKYCVSKLVLDKLISKHGISRRQSMLFSDEKDIIERIPPIVKKHFHGIWSWQLEADYKDLFNEQLPLNWLEVVDRSPTISVEKFDTKYVLRYCNPEDLLQKGKMSSLPLACDVSIPTSSVAFNQNGCLMAEVTCAVSAKEIWCRQMDTPESSAFDNMLMVMNNVYNEDKKTVKSLKVQSVMQGSYYAAFIDDYWYRIRVLEAEGKEIQCLLVDRGDDQVISIENLYQLRREFAKEQAQAFIIRLAGLEELYEVSYGSDRLQGLEGASVILESVIEDNDNSKYDPICVVMYDAETLANQNLMLIDLIPIENSQPVIDDIAPNEVFVTHTESNGDIYVQVRTFGYEKLMSMLKEIQPVLEELPAKMPSKKITIDNSKNKLYFIKTEDDASYYRVKIIDWSPKKDFAQISYVDIGRSRVINMLKTVLYPLDDIGGVLRLYPEQALRTHLDLDEVPEDFTSKITKLIPDNAPVLLRVVRKDSDGTDIVKIFVRVANSGLISVSESINIDCQNHKATNSKQGKLEKLISLNNDSLKNVPSTGILKCPPLPDVGKYFDVKVSTAVNPWNFFVQPYSMAQDLRELMSKLQSRYKDVQYGSLSIDDVKPGKIYVSKHDDGYWYRTSVIKVIHSGSISVFYCDFGYYANLRLQQVVALDPEFLELPYQAIKAKLAGIKPKQEKWSVDDCKFFEEKVRGKEFVSILVAIENDELYRSDNVLALKLIDTSTETDIHIERVLVQNQIAVNKM